MLQKPAIVYTRRGGSAIGRQVGERAPKAFGNSTLSNTELHSKAHRGGDEKPTQAYTFVRQGERQGANKDVAKKATRYKTHHGALPQARMRKLHRRNGSLSSRRPKASSVKRLEAAFFARPASFFADALQDRSVLWYIPDMAEIGTAGMKKILFFTHHITALQNPNGYRIDQYFPYLEKEGFAVGA